jgi:hypothetical protein
MSRRLAQPTFITASTSAVGRVVHYAGLARGLRRGRVEMVPIEEFAQGRSFRVIADRSPRFTGIEVARRAMSRIVRIPRRSSRPPLIRDGTKALDRWPGRSGSGLRRATHRLARLDRLQEFSRFRACASPRVVGCNTCSRALRARSWRRLQSFERERGRGHCHAVVAARGADRGSQFSSKNRRSDQDVTGHLTQPFRSHLLAKVLHHDVTGRF